MKQLVLDRIRVLNKHVTNKVLIHIAGRKFGHFAILSHTGRKSGTLLRNRIGGVSGTLSITPEGSEDRVFLEAGSSAVMCYNRYT